MTWISLPRGWLATRSARKATNSAAGVARGGLAQHLAGLRVERRVQRQRAVAVVLKAVPLGAPGRQRQHRIEPVQGLDRRLLIHAKHRRMLRRIHIQPDDIGRLGLEVRIVRAPCSDRSDAGLSRLAPHPRHHHVADPEVLASLRVLQWVEPSRGLRLDAPLQNARFQRRRQRRWQLPRVPAKQPRQTFRQKALAPAIDEAIRAVQLVADRRPSVPCIEQQDQPRTARLIGTPV